MTQFVAEAAFGEHHIQLTIILHLVKHAAQRDRQFEIHQRIKADEFLQNGRQPAGDEILRDAEPQPPAQTVFAEER
ncbi:hypothetical protein D3C86_1117410 [compost metagenome]